MNKKQITLDSNTMDKAGCTVGEIIAYLSQFPAEAELHICFNEGADTHGVDIESYIMLNVPKTAEDVRQDSIARYKRLVDDNERAIQFYIQRNEAGRVEECKLYEKLRINKEMLAELLSESTK